jgi:hypothetical protein
LGNALKSVTSSRTRGETAADPDPSKPLRWSPALIFENQIEHASRENRTKFGLIILTVLNEFAGVPPTMMVRCAHEAFHYAPDSYDSVKKAKWGSLQQFVHAFSSCEEMGSASFDVEEVHKIAVLDMRLANTDRNGGNILVCRDENNSLRLVPIDHGYCLPEKFEDITFEWLYWSQAEIPFSESTTKYIAMMDADKDIALLRQAGWSLRAPCKRVFRVTTLLLKKGAAAGLTPFAIGSMMCRETLDKRSLLEEMVEEAEQKVPISSEKDFMAAVSSVMDVYMKNAKN